MEAREVEMTAAEIRAAFEAKSARPGFGRLVRRFNAAFLATNGDTHSAMAAVNEVLDAPITYEAFVAKLARAA